MGEGRGSERGGEGRAKASAGRRKLPSMFYVDVVFYVFV